MLLMLLIDNASIITMLIVHYQGSAWIHFGHILITFAASVTWFVILSFLSVRLYIFLLICIFISVCLFVWVFVWASGAKQRPITTQTNLSPPFFLSANEYPDHPYMWIGVRKMDGHWVSLDGTHITEQNLMWHVGFPHETGAHAFLEDVTETTGINSYGRLYMSSTVVGEHEHNSRCLCEANMKRKI